VIDGSAPDWWGGLAFGMRRFLDLLPFVIVGLAELARRLQPWAVALGGSLLALWDVVLVANFLYVMKGDRDPRDAGLPAAQVEGGQGGSVGVCATAVGRGRRGGIARPVGRAARAVSSRLGVHAAGAGGSLPAGRSLGGAGMAASVAGGVAGRGRGTLAILMVR